MPIIIQRLYSEKVRPSRREPSVPFADKTAFGYVKNYFEEQGQHKRSCEINHVVTGCTGIRRSTGQHPGGIIVLPMGEEIEKFTPVQYPANDSRQWIYHHPF